MIDGGSPTELYLLDNESIFSELFRSLANYYHICDLLVMSGLLLIGIVLLLGICSKLACISGIAMMTVFYISIIPPIDNPILDYHLFYIVAIIAMYMGRGFYCLGLQEKWEGLKIVKRFPILN